MRLYKDFDYLDNFYLVNEYSQEVVGKYYYSNNEYDYTNSDGFYIGRDTVVTYFRRQKYWL